MNPPGMPLLPGGYRCRDERALCAGFLLVAFALQSTTNARWADACTRVTYLGPDDNVITARSMDWTVGTDSGS
jgi:penicillin V acylase-like amidase (Ntn superfamily)